MTQQRRQRVDALVASRSISKSPEFADDNPEIALLLDALVKKLSSSKRTKTLNHG